MGRPNEKKPKKRKKFYGEVRVDRSVIEKGHSLLEYVAGGLEVQFMVAIDFTGLNICTYRHISLYIYRCINNHNHKRKNILGFFLVFLFSLSQKKTNRTWKQKKLFLLFLHIINSLIKKNSFKWRSTRCEVSPFYWQPKYTQSLPAGHHRHWFCARTL